MKRMNLKCCTLAWLSFFFLLPVSVQAMTVDIIGRGAKGDGKTDNTRVIQAAIDACSQAKGGTVVIPAGRFMTRTLFLKSDVNLHLNQGAVLLGNTDIRTYLDVKEKTPAILFAEGVENISVTGPGTIDGQGQHPTFQQGEEMKGGLRRPKCIYFINCRNVTVQDITIKNPAEWAQFYKGCDGVVIRGLNVYAHANLNNDGLDIDSRNVIVSDCYIDADDDALCFKSDRQEACANIVVTNCILRSNCNAIKFGTSCMGGFKNIAVSNCNIQRATEDNFRQWYRILPWLGATGTSVLSGIALEAVDGGVMDQISISGIVMTDVQTPVFIRLGDRKRTSPDRISTLKNVMISDIMATQASRVACSVTGVPGGIVDNVTIKDVHITAVGGGTVAQANEPVPEMTDSYPENRLFGVVLPASGFYIRHAKNIRFENISLDLLNPDARPMFKLEDTEQITIQNCRKGNEVQANYTDRVDLKKLSSCILFRGDENRAYRDPAVLYEEGVFHLFFTLGEIEPDGHIYSYVAHSQSRNLKDWSEPVKLTPRDQALNFSSPGNVIRYKDEWILCLQTYPRPGYKASQKVRYADGTARLYTMRSRDLTTWTSPELLRVKGKTVSNEEAGRMIDPYLIRDKTDQDKYWCLFKQNGVSMSYSYNLTDWVFAGSTEAGENVSVLLENNEYTLFHSPANGIGIKKSADMRNWKDWGQLITLGQSDWNWAKGRITAGTVINLKGVEGVDRYLMFFHGSGPRTENEGDFDRNASIGIAYSSDLIHWEWPGK